MKPKILIVEDEAIIAAALKKDLLAFGYDMLPVASTADKAVALAEEHKPDIILMDIILKGKKTGIDAAREIRETHTMPILFLTGNLHMLDNVEWAKKPRHTIISKPVEMEELNQFIEKMLDKPDQHPT